MPILKVTTADGASLNVTDVGEGPAILLVHGLACDTRDWFGQIAYFRRTHRVVAVDLRGHGRSSVPVSGYDIPTFAADFVAVLDALDIASAIAIGHSMGGILVRAFATLHPGRVAAVVAIDPLDGLPDASTRFDAMAPLVAEPGGLAKIFENSESPLTPPGVREAHQFGAQVTDLAVLTKVWQECLLDPDSIARDPAALAQRQAPLLALHGRSQVGAAERDGEHFVHPADRSLELPVGHWIHHDAPDLTNEIIAQWLATSTSAT